MRFFTFVALSAFLCTAALSNFFYDSTDVYVEHEGVSYKCIYVAEDDQPFLSSAPNQTICFQPIDTWLGYTDYTPYFYIENNQLSYF